ncbi:MAG TPA: hypothetical protein VE685_17410 [Thermoanaerobaculia bacterium]|nr:hypothetical protein [Thermoanaerobaculia bacterium]
MGLEISGWTILGSAFRCQEVPDRSRADLEALLQGFPRLDHGTAQAEELAIEPENGGEPSAYQLEYRLINAAIERARDRWVLHAGAVAGPDGTCLIVGESGAGKTSLTLWLWAHGLRLVTDDLCPLAHGSLTPEVFPRALHMDGHYSPRLLERIPPRPASYPAEYYPFPGQAGVEVPPVKALLAVERGPFPEGRLEPLSQAEAAHRFLKAVIKNPSFQFDRALEDMMRLSRQSRSALLRSSTPEGAGTTALAWLREIL